MNLQSNRKSSPHLIQLEPSTGWFIGVVHCHLGLIQDQLRYDLKIHVPTPHRPATCLLLQPAPHISTGLSWQFKLRWTMTADTHSITSPFSTHQLLIILSVNPWHVRPLSMLGDFVENRKNLFSHENKSKSTGWINYKCFQWIDDVWWRLSLSSLSKQSCKTWTWAFWPWMKATHKSNPVQKQHLYKTK